MTCKLPICSDKLDAMIGVFLTDLATIYRKSYVSDGGGGQVDSYTSVGTYPCSLEKYPVQAREYERAPGVLTIMEWLFIFQVSTVVQQTDRIDCRGRHFEVTGQGLGTHSISNEVLCKEII